ALGQEAQENLLDMTVITADRLEESKREVTSNITVITQKDLELSAAGDLGDLMREKGFQIRKYPGGQTAVGLRGFRSDSSGSDLGSRVLILVNGQRTAAGNLALIMLDSVERVEIIRGPASLQYGSAAMGGVINVITKKGRDGLAAKAELGLGSFDTFKSLAGFSGRRSDLDFYAAWSHSKSGDYQDGRGLRYENSAMDRNDSVNTSLGYTINELHRFGAEFNYTNLEGLGSPGSRSNPSRIESMDRSNQSARLSYTGGSPGGDWTWSASYTYAEDENVYYKLTDWLTGSLYDMHSRIKADLIQTQASWNGEYFRLTAGWDFNGYETDSYDSNNLPGRMQADYDNSAFFLIGKILLLDERFIISAGARYDEYKIDIKGYREHKEHNVSPSFGLAYSVLPELKLRANYSQGFRMPGIYELTDNPGWGSYGNLNLKPEKSETFEFGFDLAYEYADLSFTYFQSRHKDYIVSIQTAPFIYNYMNWENKIERSGIEIEASLDAAGLLGQNFELRPYLSYNLMTKYHDLASGYKIPFVPSFTAGYGLRFIHPEYNLSAQLNFSYMGPEYENTNETGRKSGYTVASLTVRKRVLDFGGRGHLDIRAEVQNLFDRYYASIRDYPAPGRSFLAAVSYVY
ncbi:MAG: TonB-dependent receptor, partial [Deltaproteobacteria bacterium]|nr:TonB-dependent receptor [Deltaproteobacteria bacterium]